MARVLFALLLTYSPAALAETLIEIGIHYGGEVLITENYTNGAKNSNKAGNLFSLSLGGMKSFTQNIDGQLSLGVKSDIINSSNPEVTWQRYLLNSILFYRQEKYRIGLGLTAHLSPTLKADGVASNVSENYKDAIGGLFEVDFNIDKTFLWGIRYTNIKYESDRRDKSVSGDSLGLLIIALL